MLVEINCCPGLRSRILLGELPSIAKDGLNDYTLSIIVSDEKCSLTGLPYVSSRGMPRFRDKIRRRPVTDMGYDPIHSRRPTAVA